MKPKLALKLVPISGLVIDLHTATLLVLWGGKASHAQQYKPKRRRKEYLENEKMPSRSDENGVNKKSKSRNYRNAAKNWNIEDNNGKTFAFRGGEAMSRFPLTNFVFHEFESLGGIHECRPISFPQLRL